MNRNSKSKILNPKQIPNPKSQQAEGFRRQKEAKEAEEAKGAKETNE